LAKYGASIDLVLKDSCVQFELDYGSSESRELQITSLGINYSPIINDRDYGDKIILGKICFK
jgi:hypothetical protein